MPRGRKPKSLKPQEIQRLKTHPPALKHGLFLSAQNFISKHKDQYQTILNLLEKEYQPQSTTEKFLVQYLALLQLRLLLCLKLQNSKKPFKIDYQTERTSFYESRIFYRILHTVSTLSKLKSQRNRESIKIICGYAVGRESGTRGSQ